VSSRRVGIFGGVAVLLAACGSSTNGKPLTIRSVADATVERATARFVVDEENQYLEGRYDFERAAGTAHDLSADASDNEIRFLPEGMYLDTRGLPDFSPLPGDGPCFSRRWALLSASALEDDDPELHGVAAPVPIAPGGVLDALAGAGAVLERDGEEEVRGVMTTRYRVDVTDLRLSGAFTLDRRTGRHLVSMSAWVDRDERLRRIAWTNEYAEVGPPAIGSSQTTLGLTVDESTRVELWDFGVDVHVDRPAPSETCDLFAQTGSDDDF
jgi:hypothetical protein